MRCLLSSVVTCLLLSGTAFAQDPDPATLNYDKTGQQPVTKKTPRLHVQPRSRVVISPESAARLLHERAVTQARMRRARIEARKWAGVSLMRPWVGDERPSVAAWGAGSPWWWNTSTMRLRMQW